jgi:hypothetical protein
MFAIVNVLMLLQILTYDYNWTFADAAHMPVILLTGIFLFCIMLNPFNMIYRNARFDLLQTFGRLVTTPLYSVRF